MSESRKFLSTILFLLFVCSSAQAQKTISGTVTDAQTEETLPSANILIKDTYRGTITNSNGNFSLTIPESLLPATLLIRYIGYETQQLTITKNSSAEHNISLKPSVTKMQEIVVTDEDPGMRIMREVIKRKQQWRKQLETYRAEAYTRQTLSNDTAIVSITESVSEVFWDKQRGHREVQKSKRQTANIEAASNFAGVSYLPNFYDDNIEIAEFNLVGITHPDALDYYDFKLVDQTSLDNQTVYEIEVTPARKLQPLFKGTAYILANEYALLEVDLVPNDVVTFPAPIKSFKTSYEQQFNNFGQDFWLPIDVRIGGDIKIKMVGLDFPMIKFKQLSRITNYRVNTSLPDSLYKKEDRFSVDSTTVQSDSLIAQQVNTVPLSSEEELAYATLDSTATLEKAFKPSGFLAKFIDDEEGEENESNPGFLNFLDEVPGKITPDGRYNRVDQAFVGLRYSIDATDWLNIRSYGGYSSGYRKWNYGGGLTIEWLQQNWASAVIGGNYRAGTETRYYSHIYNPYYTTIPNLLGHQGYFDYYRLEGFRIFSGWDFPHNLSLEMGFNHENHTSLPTTTAYDILGNSNFLLNPSIPEGTLKSLDITAGYNIDEGYNFGVTTQKKIKLSIEHSSDALGSDYEFTRYTGFLSWSFPTFYQRRFLANTLDFNIKGGTYSGDLPLQKWGIIDGTIGSTAPYGVMKTIRNRPYQGQQYLSITAEHNFRTIPFELLGLRPLVNNNIGFIVFAGTAKTWVKDSFLINQPGYTARVTNGVHWEAGASLNGILDLFRVDFATRLDEPAFLVNISIARLF